MKHALARLLNARSITRCAPWRMRPVPRRAYATRPAEPRPGTRRWLWPAAVFVIAGAAAYAVAAPRRRSRSLNQDTFVPFTVVARESVSPTAAVLTLRLAADTEKTTETETETTAAIARARAHGLWSVEVRQPQLQIARDYTPLPTATATPSTIRLFVRAVPGGEVSRYLLQRAVGDAVELRGPRLGFDVARRLGTAQRIVVVAGGTGIAPALQAADVLGDGSKTLTILWASRQGVDCQGLDADSTETAPNPVVRDLAALQRRLGRGRVQVRRFVDEQQTLITEAAVRESLGGRRGWWWEKTKPTAATTQTACRYHSPQVLERLASDPETETAADGCACASPGKNLLIVSGPDGFVTAWAGAKTWAGGQERQGPVGGVAKRVLQKQTDGQDWQVLKL